MPADRHLSSGQFRALRQAPTVPTLLGGGDPESFPEWADRDEGADRNRDTYESYQSLVESNAELARKAYPDID